MKKNLKEDFEIAEKLNRRLAVPSDCFELTYLSKVSCIVCADEVFAIETAKLLKENLRLFGCYAKIMIRPDLEILSEGEIDTDLWWKLVSEINALPFETKDIMLVGRREIACRAAADIMLKGIKVAVLEQFMQKDWGTRTLVSCDGKMNGAMKLQNCDYLVVYGDDMKIVKAVREPLELLERIYGPNGPSGQPRQIVNLGGIGVFSRMLYPYLSAGDKCLTEAALQQKTGRRLFFGVKDNIVLDNSNNIGDALGELAKTIGEGKVIMVLPQRYSLIVKFTHLQQFPQLNLRYLVMRESVAESCRYLNGMKFCHKTPILHFWAHVLPRWESYSQPRSNGQPFMIPVFGISNGLRSEAARLSRKYLLKQQTHNPRRYWQELQFRFELWRKGYLAAEDYRQLLCPSH